MQHGPVASFRRCAAAKSNGMALQPISLAALAYRPWGSGTTWAAAARARISDTICIRMHAPCQLRMLQRATPCKYLAVRYNSAPVHNERAPIHLHMQVSGCGAKQASWVLVCVVPHTYAGARTKLLVPFIVQGQCGRKAAITKRRPSHIPLNTVCKLAAWAMMHDRAGRCR